MRLGVLGGTFDPIHTGHLALAAVSRAALDLETVLLVPSAAPPHRPDAPRASSHHRFAMAAFAASLEPWLRASDLEVTAPPPSYTATTLRLIGAMGYPPSQIFFITGADAFAEIATWREYPDVLDLAHFVVVSRPGADLETLPEALPALAPRFHPASAGPGPGGATSPTRILLLPADTPDVSSTEIRARLAAGLPVDDLLPAQIAEHARRHHLYTRQSPAVGERPAPPASPLHPHE